MIWNNKQIFYSSNIGNYKNELDPGLRKFSCLNKITEFFLTFKNHEKAKASSSDILKKKVS